MEGYTLLSNINSKRDMWSILVRVQRKWNVYHKENPNDLFYISMLLIDIEVLMLICYVLLFLLLPITPKTLPFLLNLITNKILS